MYKYVYIYIYKYFFPQQQNAMGSLRNIVSVCSGRAGAVPGKNGFREPFRNRFRWFRGLDRFQGSEVPGTGSNGFRGLDRLQSSEVPGTGSNGSGIWEPGSGNQRCYMGGFRTPEIRFPRPESYFVL